MSLKDRLRIPVALIGLIAGGQGVPAQPYAVTAGGLSLHTGLIARALGTHPAVGGSIGRAFSGRGRGCQ